MTKTEKQFNDGKECHQKNCLVKEQVKEQGVCKQRRIKLLRKKEELMDRRSEH